LVCLQYTLLYFSDFIKISFLRKILNRFRHAADKIVLLKSLYINLFKRSDHFVILAVKELCKLSSCYCHQKFPEGKWIKFQKIYFSHRKRGSFMKCDPQQRSGTDNMILGRIFIKIFKRRKSSWHFLDLVKNQKSTVWIDLFSRSEERRVGKECRSSGWS